MLTNWVPLVRDLCFQLISTWEMSLARSLISDDEWTFFESFIPAVRHPNGRKPADHRLVLDEIFWWSASRHWFEAQRDTRTGAPWRDLPEEFGKWSSVCRQFRRWTLAGLWEDILDAARTRRGSRRTSCRWSTSSRQAPPVRANRRGGIRAPGDGEWHARQHGTQRRRQYRKVNRRENPIAGHLIPRIKC